MKLVLFAQTPPPHHGQSYMTRLLLDGLGGDARRRAPGATPPPHGIEVFHVNARLSSGAEDIGRAQWHKPLLLLRYCAEALWCRVRHGATHLYYVPAPPARVPLYRDWLVMALCRPFFKTLTLHWHAAGLGEWLATRARPWERTTTRWLLGRHQLSLVLSESGRSDAASLRARRIEILPDGVPDPCPGFHDLVLPHRASRSDSRKRVLAEPSSGAAENRDGVFQVCFLGLCCREKGLFDALDAVALLISRLGGRQSPLRVRFLAAGQFADSAVRSAFEQRVSLPDLQDGAEPVARWLGFLDAPERNRLLRESDCLCFPTYYPAESFGLVVVEAMACGLPVVATRWRAIPDILPPDTQLLVEPHAPARVADALESVMRNPPDPAAQRQRFLERFALERHIEAAASALRRLED